VQRLALSTGRTLKIIDPQIAAKTYRQMRTGERDSARRGLVSIRRILDRESPDYAS
jgi:hypothetical protein